MLNKEKQVTGFILVDLINNVQEYVTGGDLKSLKEAQENGCAFVAEYADGTKSVVEPEEIDFSLLGIRNTINIVEQEVFVPLMTSMLDLMEESMTPAVALLSVSGQKKVINSKFNDFKEKVEAMKERYLPNIEGKDDGDTA